MRNSIHTLAVAAMLAGYGAFWAWAPQWKEVFLYGLIVLILGAATTRRARSGRDELPPAVRAGGLLFATGMLRGALADAMGWQGGFLPDALSGGAILVGLALLLRVRAPGGAVLAATREG